MRARFIGPDGCSFFEEVFEYLPMWKRFRKRFATWPNGSPVFDPGDRPVVERHGIETYYREFWLHKYGPLAVPVLDENGEIVRDKHGFMGEIVYRYSGFDSG